MTGPNSAEYERGWRDAMEAATPPGTVERAALNTAATGLVRRFADAMGYVAADMDRIARTMAALDIEPDEARRIEDGAWASVWLHADWRWITKNMTTDEKESAARAVERHWDTTNEGPEDDVAQETRAELWWWRS